MFYKRIALKNLLSLALQNFGNTQKHLLLTKPNTYESSNLRHGRFIDK